MSKKILVPKFGGKVGQSELPPFNGPITYSAMKAEITIVNYIYRNNQKQEQAKERDIV